MGKGLYSQDTLNEITRRMLKALEQSGAKITSVYYCTHRDEDRCSCRKPKAGLIRLAVKDKNIDLKNSFLSAILSAMSAPLRPPDVNPSWFSPEQKSLLTKINGKPARILPSKTSTPPPDLLLTICLPLIPLPAAGEGRVGGCLIFSLMRNTHLVEL